MSLPALQQFILGFSEIKALTQVLYDSKTYCNESYVRLETFCKQNNLRSVAPVPFKTVSLQGGDIDAIYGRKFYITIFTPILMKIRTDVEWQRRARMSY